MELNRSQLAEAFAVDLLTVDRWRTQGCPFEKRGRNILFIVSEVHKWVVSTKVRAAVSSTSPADLDEARARKTSAQAQLAEIELQRERGEVVPILEVADAVGVEYAAVRSRLLAIPPKLAPLMVNTQTARESRELLEQAIHEALSELSSDDCEPAA